MIDLSKVVFVGAIVLASFSHVKLAAQSASEAASETVAPELVFQFTDGSRLQGMLQGGKGENSISIRCPLLTTAVEASVDDLLEANGVAGSESAAEQNGADSELFAAHLVDDSQLVGRLSSWDSEGFKLSSALLGDVSLTRDHVVSLRRLIDVPGRIASLVSLPTRYELQDGWNWGDGKTLVAERPGAVVGRLALPERFRLLVDIECTGDADVQLALGDRASGGAGQGSRFRLGGSVSQSPEEQLVTHCEWFGSSLSLVRGNASISDVAMVPLDDAKRLRLEFRIDQRAGRLIALSSGNEIGGTEIGRAELTDGQPIIRQTMTLTNRGDSIRVHRLDVMHWDGQSEQPAELSGKRMELLSGTTVEPQDWDQVAERGDLSSVSFGNEVKAAPGCEMTLRDQTRLRGRLLQSEDGRVRFETQLGMEFEIDPLKVSQVIGLAKRLNQTTGPSLQNGTQLIHGKLVSAGGIDDWIAFQSPMFRAVTGIAANPSTKIDFQLRASPSEFSPRIVLRGGDQMGGEVTAINQQGIQFDGTYCGSTIIPEDSVRSIQSQAVDPIEDRSLEHALSLPRMQKSSPPTHLLVSPQADLLRGRLLGLDGDAATLSVRQVERRINRSSIGEVVFLDAEQRPEFQSEQARIDAVIETAIGERLSLTNVQYDENDFHGDHQYFGRCRIPRHSIRTVWLGLQPHHPSSRWQLRPVKDPRSYDDESAAE
ncbi:hypothetical protein LOC67_04075 [Stieleria sp. JC731]|uniref:hypothetical protein n=1 Tax=Pirellulaceae TaxID=2691357 RepID=UPI001E38ACA1|nr:hypothetical protein [Stieleria sp. JC731]MCC9599728.1 hypothetical protein [Stieleria sp. JC731]